jgi:hypothetical protein
MIKINLEKAKVIGHGMRRQKRDIEFAPHDADIAKQIPGKAEVAEAERAKIREKYALIQTQIDEATTTDQIKAALGL